MNKILIKEIDIKIIETYIVSEYLIYYIENGENINAYIELGEVNKNKRIEKIKLIKGENILIEEMGYKDYVKQK